jgi:predicted nuclease of predicted toxin-antitoxin system
MKFLIDEQLPAILADWLSSKGFDAVHALTLSTNTSLSDKEIRRWRMNDERIVITKDEDFFNAYIFQKEPYKLIFLTTGNIKNRQLLDLFRANFDHIVDLMEKHDVVELKKDFIKVWF